MPDDVITEGIEVVEEAKPILRRRSEQRNEPYRDPVVPALGTVGAILIVVCALFSLNGMPALTPHSITMQHYARVVEGMSYDQVLRIIGKPGEEIASNHLDGMGFMPNISTKMYQWLNADGTGMNAMFQNGRLITKAQMGLR